MIIATCEQMKAIERKTIEEYRIPGLILMEHAASAVSAAVEKLRDITEIWIVCGAGNNGGDGLAVARQLFMKGYDVHVLLIGNMTNQSADALVMYRAILGLSIQVEHVLAEEDLPVFGDEKERLIIDGLFGIGCTRPVAGVHLAAIHWMNRTKGKVISIDIPSGIHGDTGHSMGGMVMADTTVTFTLPKIGNLVSQGRLAGGELIVSEIGIPECVLKEFDYHYELIDRDILRFMPVRPLDGHKMTFGRLLVIAGSETMSGAGILSVEAAYRAGAGLVEILTHINGLTAIQQAVPEAIVHSYRTTEEGQGLMNKIGERLSDYKAILIGPGLGKSDMAKALVKMVLEQAQCPLVIDADGLNILPTMLEFLDAYSYPVILTPHIGEMGRLVNHSANDVVGSSFAYAEAYSKAHGVITVLKSDRTIVTDGSGSFCINSLGNPGMATAGSGDVLAGIIAAMIGQGAEPFTAAVLGVGLHGFAGDIAAINRGEHSLMASDIIDGLQKILTEWEN